MDANTSLDYHSHALDKDNTEGHNTCVNFNYISYITYAYFDLLCNDSFGHITNFKDIKDGKTRNGVVAVTNYD